MFCRNGEMFGQALQRRHDHASHTRRVQSDVHRKGPGQVSGESLGAALLSGLEVQKQSESG